MKISVPISDLAGSQKSNWNVPKSPIKVLNFNLCMQAKIIRSEPLTSWNSKLVRNELN